MLAKCLSLSSSPTSHSLVPEVSSPKMVVRDEMLVIIDITPGVIRAGVGVYDLIRAPQIEVSTRVGRKQTTKPSRTVDDYVVGHLYANAQQAGEQLEIVDALTVGQFGLQVTDWVALEAILRYLVHTGLSLQRPPLAHPYLVSIPPHLPTVLVDQLHALFFEQLLVPQLLIATRPFFAAAAAGVLNCLVLDIGQRGEGSEISAVYESQVVENATMRFDVDEGTLDDWCALKLLEEDPDLPRKLSPSYELSSSQLCAWLRTLVGSLKAADAIGVSTTLSSATSTANQAAPADDGDFDIAKVLVEGKVDKVIGKKKSGKKGEKGGGGDDDDEAYVEVAHPIDVNAEPLRIGPARHRYLEPLFAPQLLRELAPSNSDAAKRLDLQTYEERPIEFSGVHELIGATAALVPVLAERRGIWEAIVVISSSKVANNRALGNTLVPLLSPFVVAADNGSEAQPRGVRYARTPDYFSEFKTRQGELACFLGGSIMAKILISDLTSRLFMSKVDYTHHGPAFYRMLDTV